MKNDSFVRKAIDRRGLATFTAATLACVLVAAAALFHLWIRTRVTERGYQLSRLSSTYRELIREHESLQLKAAELKSPQRIEELAREKLGMGPPAVDRVVVLSSNAPACGLRPAWGEAPRLPGAVRASLVASVR